MEMVRDSWVRVKNGLYKDDLAKVGAREEVPLEVPLEVPFGGEEESAGRGPGGRAGCEAWRPLRRLAQQRARGSRPRARPARVASS
jgi:hypothetical protein